MIWNNQGPNRFSFFRVGVCEQCTNNYYYLFTYIFFFLFKATINGEYLRAQCEQSVGSTYLVNRDSRQFVIVWMILRIFNCQLIAKLESCWVKCVCVCWSVVNVLKQQTNEAYQLICNALNYSNYVQWLLEDRALRSLSLARKPTG